MDHPIYIQCVTFLRRNWAVLLALILIPLVLLLAILQLDWIRNMGERERMRLRQGLFVAAGDLASAFQRELLLAPWALVPLPFGDSNQETSVVANKPGQPQKQPASRTPYSAALDSGNWTFFTGRLATLHGYAIDSKILKSIHVIDQREGKDPRLLTWNGSTFVTEKDSDYTAKLIGLFDDWGRLGWAQDLRPRRGFRGIGSETWDLVPVPNEAGLYLLLHFDDEVIADSVIPRLATLHLGDMSDYSFRISDRSTGAVLYRSEKSEGDEAFSQADIRLGLLRQNSGYPDFGSRSQLSALRPGEAPLFMPRPLRGGPDGNVTESPATSLSGQQRPPDTLWVLEAVHRQGSLASIVRMSTIRSAAASSGILLLLGVALVVLALANRRAQALASRQEEFVASVTHELKTPLAVIGSAAENLADGIVRDSDGLIRYGSTIGAETRRLTAMIDKLLLYTKLGSGKAAGKDEVDLSSLVSDIVAERLPEFSALKFQVELDLPGEPLLVPGDESALSHAAANLVSNVLVHASEGRYIGISLGEETRKRGRGTETRALLRVEDRGPGIPRRERALVFEAFYRGKRAREAQEAGSGIGLNLVRRVVLAHGGSVSLESTEGHGTSVAMRLPIVAMDQRHG